MKDNQNTVRTIPLILIKSKVPLINEDIAFYLGSTLFFLGFGLNLWTLKSLGIKGNESEF